MSTWSPWTLAALVLSLAWSAPAQARFGRHGGAPFHSAQPVPSSRPYSGYRSYAPYYGSYGYRPSYVYRPWGYGPYGGYYGGVYYGSGYAYGPGYGYYGYGYPPYAGPGVVAQPPPQGQAAPVMGSFWVNGLWLSSGGGVDLGASFEGERLGVNFTYTGLFLRPDNGSAGMDHISLFNGFLTYAVISQPQGRLRIEAGGMSALAPDLLALGPGLGVSGAVGLWGPLGADASVRVTPFPFRQVDAKAGLTLAVGPLGLKAGVRSLYLNDAGMVDGVVHADYFFGPYGGLEVVY